MNDDEYFMKVANLMQRIKLAKVAFNIPIGESTHSDDSDYLEAVGRITIEELNERLAFSHRI